jgi:hypothetical protein
MTTNTPATATDYTTSDLGLAAFLIVRGYPLTDVGGAPGGRRTFHFPVSAHEEAGGFYRGAAVPARTYANALRDLKALVR